MKAVLFLFSFFLFFFFSSLASPRIAIVGAGIGGASCSYYLDQFAQIRNIDVFETRNYIGGRINEIEIGGQIEEIGADAWSNVNYYLQELYVELGLELSTSTYNGNGIVTIYGESFFIDWQKYAGLEITVDRCVEDQIQTFIKHLSANYIQRQINGPFKTINDFLAAGAMANYSTTVFENYLRDSCNATQQYMDTLVAPVVRAIYDQPLTIQSFAGEVSLVSIATPPYWLANGNSQLPKSMFSASQAKVHLNTKIDKISWNGQNYTLYYNNTNYPLVVDYVVLAAPIEKMEIEFDNIVFSQNITYRDFVTCFVTHIEATAVNPVFFGLVAGDEAPDVILTTPECTLPFTILQVEDPSLTNPGQKIYKIFSNSNIQDQLNDIFLNVTDYHVHAWEYTFPKLIVTDTFQPVILAENLYYLNTMESVASAMEASVISGRNVAQLISQSLNRM